MAVCDYCKSNVPNTAINVEGLAPHTEISLCGRCYSSYKRGILRFYPATRQFGPAPGFEQRYNTYIHFTR